MPSCLSAGVGCGGVTTDCYVPTCLSAGVGCGGVTTDRVTCRPVCLQGLVAVGLQQTVLHAILSVCRGWLWWGYNRPCYMPFESFLGKIKQMLRKPQFPLSQVIRGLSEMHNVLKVDTKLKKCSLKEEHTLGPLPFEFRQYTQFSGIHYNDLYFSINDGDNCIKVGSSYGLIRNICKGPCDESEPVVFF